MTVRIRPDAVREELTRQGHPEVALQVKRYVEQMPKPLTEREYIATKLLERARNQKSGKSKWRARNCSLRGQFLARRYGVAAEFDMV